MSSRAEPQPLSSLERRFRGRIGRTFLAIFLPLVLIPILVMGIAAYDRAYSLLEAQIQGQLETNIRSLSEDLSTWVRTREIRLSEAVRNTAVRNNLAALSAQETSPDYQAAAQAISGELRKQNTAGESIYFNDYLILDTSGKVVFSTVPEWQGINLGGTDHFEILAEQAHTIVAYRPEGLYDELTVLSSVHVPARDQQPAVVVYGVSRAYSLQIQLAEVVRFHETAQAYLVTDQNQFIALDRKRNLLDRAEPSEEQTGILLPAIRQEQGERAPLIILTSFDSNPWVTTYRWLPDLGIGLAIEVPEDVIFGQINSLAPLTIGLFGITTIVLAGLIWIATGRLVKPIGALTEITNQFALGNWEQRATVRSKDEIGLLSYAFNQMAEELSGLYRSLEDQVLARTQQLNRRSRQLEATAQVAREAAGIRSLNQLLNDVTRLISEFFGFYHVGIFLLDQERLYAVLQAANSAGGQRMLARAHKLRVGRVGVVGNVAGTGRPRIALDVGADAEFFDNPDLPLTRSEMALPLKIQERVIGVLDVQSTEPGAFSEEDVEVLQTLADLITLAIENARLIEQDQQTLAQLESFYGQQVRADWNKLLGGQARGYRYDQVRLQAITPAQINAALADSADAQAGAEPGNHRLTIPITLRGQKLGNLVLHRQQNETPWTEEEHTIATETAAQVAVALENARLLEQSRKQAEHEQTVGKISARLSQSIDIDSILQAAVFELGQLPLVNEVAIHIGQPKKK